MEADERAKVQDDAHSWVIGHYHHHYLPYEYYSAQGWVADKFLAIRFARELDARRAIQLLQLKGEPGEIGVKEINWKQEKEKQDGKSTRNI